jgi:hypothetical protein
MLMIRDTQDDFDEARQEFFQSTTFPDDCAGWQTNLPGEKSRFDTGPREYEMARSFCRLAMICEMLNNLWRGFDTMYLTPDVSVVRPLDGAVVLVTQTMHESSQKLRDVSRFPTRKADASA